MDVLDSQGLKLATLEPYSVKTSETLVGSIAAETLDPGDFLGTPGSAGEISIQAALTGETAIGTDRIAASTATTTSLNSGDSITGFVNSRGDHDWFRVQLTAGNRYQFNLNRVSGRIDPLLSLRNNAGVLLTQNDDANGGLNSEILYTATSTGTYYLDAGAYANSSIGQYRLLVSQMATDQYAADTSTTGVIAAGGSITSTIDSLGDHDWFRISLTAGTSYTFNLNQVGSGGLANPLLALRNSSGVVLTSNDDANGSMNSQISFTASSTGTYYLDAGAFADSGTGQYQLLVSQQATDQYAADTSTTGVIAVGGSITSTIDSLGDHDWFRISLTAGRSYTFNLNQVGSSGLSDPLLALRNSSGVVLTSNDDANGSMNSQISFTASSTGTYYLDAGAFADTGTGQYQLLAAETSVTPPPSTGFSSVTGYGEANVKRALEAMLNTSLPSVADLGGIFWGLDRLGAPEAWNAGYTGRGITVAVVDTGVDYTHSDLDGNIWINSREIAGNGIDDDGNGYIDDVRGWNFDANTNNVMDDNSHGTHVAGTIAGENNGVGITGVAYNARIMAVKVLNGNGSGTLAAVANGIRYAANNGAQVINLSLGGGGSSELLAAVSYATSRGAVVVMAAGNESAAAPSSPASYASSYGLAVGAIDSGGNLASFSNRAGSTPLDYITAAGVNVYSSVPGGGYASYSGTSMATPHIAGAMALLQQANIQNNKGLSVAALETLITSTASNMVTASTLGATSTSTSGSTTTLQARSLEREDVGPKAFNRKGDVFWSQDTESTIPGAAFSTDRAAVALVQMEPRTESRSTAALGMGERQREGSRAAGAGSTSIPEAMVSTITNLTSSRRLTSPRTDPLTGLRHDPENVLNRWSLATV